MQQPTLASPPSDSPPRLAPGPGNYYILRHLRQAARDVIGLYTQGWQTYGDIVRFHWHGPHSLYLCVHPQMVERILQANWTNYSKGFFYQRLSIFTGQGLFTSSGDLWRKQRRLAQPAFHRAKIAALAGVMTQTVAEMLHEWESQPDGKPFDMAEEMMRLTLQIAGRTLFGTDLKGDAHEFHQLMNTAMMHVEHRFNPLTWPESVPTPRNRRYLSAKEQLDEWILGMAQRRRETGEQHDDLLQMLLDARDEESGEAMSDRQLADEVLTLLVAGHETTADALAWGFSLLARNPDKREQLEVEARTLNGRGPVFDDLGRLPYSKMVFEEALRLYPPIWALAREAKEDDEIGGYTVPARSSIVVPPYLTHRHPEFWPEPEKFEPERFTPENVAARPKFAYYPFGGGPRLCLGQSFAWMEGQIALSMITSRFRLDLVPGEKLEMHPSLALRPKGGLWMTRRSLS